MAKKMDAPLIDGGLTAISGCTTLSICSAEPVNRAGIAALTLASVAITGVDFTIANGDTSGRKVTVAQQIDMAISTSGTGNHVAIDDGVNMHVTTCTPQVLTNGGTVTAPAYDHEIAAPV